MKLTLFCVSTTSGLLHDVFQNVSVHPIPIEFCYGLLSDALTLLFWFLAGGMCPHHSSCSNFLRLDSFSPAHLWIYYSLISRTLDTERKQKSGMGGERIVTLTGWTHRLHTKTKRKCVSILHVTEHSITKINGDGVNTYILKNVV